MEEKVGMSFKMWLLTIATTIIFTAYMVHNLVPEVLLIFGIKNEILLELNSASFPMILIMNILFIAMWVLVITDTWFSFPQQRVKIAIKNNIFIFEKISNIGNREKVIRKLNFKQVGILTKYRFYERKGSLTGFNVLVTNQSDNKVIYPKDLTGIIDLNEENLLYNGKEVNSEFDILKLQSAVKYMLGVESDLKSSIRDKLRYVRLVNKK